MGSIAAILGYFFYPETKGVRFEKLDQLYDAGVPPRHFKSMAQRDTTDNIIGAKEAKQVEVQVDQVEHLK